MSGWEHKAFGLVCDFVRGPFGGSLKKAYFKSTGYAVYEQQHAINDQFESIRYFIDKEKFQEMNRFELNSGDLIMSCSGTMGKIAIVPNEIQPGIINQALLKLTPTKIINVYFLKYWMSSPNFQKELDRLSQGVAIKNVASVKVLKEIQTPLPNLQEQKRIVTILDKVFEEIDKAIANTEQNLINARELFESHLSNTFTQKGKEWKEKKFSEVCSFVRGPFGGSLKKSFFEESGYAIYEQQHAIRNQFSSIRYFINKQKFNEMRRFELHPGDLIMSCSGTMGKIAIVPTDIQQGIINQALLKLTPNKTVNAEFLKFWMQSSSFQEQIEKFSKGAAIKNVASVKILKEISFYLPTIAIQVHTVSKLNRYFKNSTELYSTHKKKLASLKELRQSFLQRAFSGELTNEPETKLGDAA